MRNLSSLNDFTISAKSENVCRSDLPSADLWIEDFFVLGKKEDNSYFMKIKFSGYLIIRSVLYTFKFSVNLITDNVTDIEAIVPSDLKEVLDIMKTDFFSADSKILMCIMQTILSFYDNNFLIMAL